MNILVTGASSSGKSALAESIAVSLGGKRYYLATMHAYGAEGERRVARHRQMRADKGFETIERFTNLGAVPIEPHSVCLLECLSNLLANEMYDAEGAQEHAVLKICADLKTLAGKCDHLIVVTNEIFSDGQRYDDFCTRYIENLGLINQSFAEFSDVFLECVVGIPLYRKGERDAAF